MPDPHTEGKVSYTKESILKTKHLLVLHFTANNFFFFGVVVYATNIKMKIFLTYLIGLLKVPESCTK